MDKISIEQSLRWVQGFLRREWQLALPISLAFIALPSLASTLVIAQQLPATMPQTVGEMQALVALLPWWLTPLLLVFSLVMLTGGLALIALGLLPQVSVGEAIQVGMRRLPAALGIVLLLWVALTGLLILLGVGAGMAGLAPAMIVALTFIAMAAAGIFLLLLLPLIVDRRLGPVAAIRASRRFWRGTALRLASGILLYMAVSFVIVLSIQVALGSLIIMLAAIGNAADVGRLIVTVLSSAATALQFGGLFLLLAAFYRQRVGRD